MSSRRNNTAAANKKMDISSSSSCPPSVVLFDGFDPAKLVVQDPFKTKYNAWARLKYEGGPFILRTPVFKRVFLNKWPDKDSLSVSFPLDGYDVPGTDVNKFTDDVICNTEAGVVNQLAEKGVKVPNNKRVREGTDTQEDVFEKTFSAASPDTVRLMLKSLINPGKEGRSPMFTSEVAVQNPTVKKLEKLIPAEAKIVDADRKLINIKDAMEMLEDKDYIYPVRAIINFSHVYMPTDGVVSNTKRMGIKHYIVALQFMKGEPREQMSKNVSVADEQVADMFM